MPAPKNPLTTPDMRAERRKSHQYLSQKSMLEKNLELTLVLNLVGEVERRIASPEITCHSTHLQRLYEMERCVVETFECHVAHGLTMAQEYVVQRIGLLLLLSVFGTRLIEVSGPFVFTVFGAVISHFCKLLFVSTNLVINVQKMVI